MRGIKALAISMAVLLGVGLVALGVGLYYKVQAMKSPGFAQVYVAPDGCALAGTDTADGRLVLHFKGAAECRRLELVDLETGKTAGTVRLKPAPAGDR